MFNRNANRIICIFILILQPIIRLIRIRSGVVAFARITQPHKLVQRSSTGPRTLAGPRLRTLVGRILKTRIGYRLRKYRYSIRWCQDQAFGFFNFNILRFHFYFLSLPQIPIQRPILYRLADMLWPYWIRTCKIGPAKRDPWYLEYPVIHPCRESELCYCHLHQLLSCRIDRNDMNTWKMTDLRIRISTSKLKSMWPGQTSKCLCKRVRLSSSGLCIT